MTGSSAASLTALALACGLLSLGCGDSGGTPPVTTNIAKISGDAQIAIVGQVLPQPLVAQVTSGGVPSAGTTVTWSTTTPGGSLLPESSPTGADGQTSTNWRVGTASGTQSAAARVSGGSLVTFTAIVLADVATAVVKAGGDEQIAEVGSPLPLPVQARVTDQHGNGVPSVAVGWAATGGTVSSPSVTSDAAGLSSVTVTAGGTVGPIVITATAHGLSGSPLTFNATAVVTAVPPTSIAVTVGNDFFRSNRNNTSDPAVDTVAVNGTVTWTWGSTGLVTHSVESDGTPSFTSSAQLTGPGQTYSFQFLAAGTYEYTCAVHPGQMTGRIVVR